MKKSVFILWSFVLLLLFNGCNLDGFDFDKLSSEVNISPEFVAPIANAKISVWDMVQSANKENDSVITTDQNGLIKIVYKQDSLFKYDVGEFLNFSDEPTIPTEKQYLPEIAPDNVNITSSIQLNDLVNLMAPALDAIKPLNGMSLPFPAIVFPGPAASFPNSEQIIDFTSITLSAGNLEVVLENKLKVPVTIQGVLFDKLNNRPVKDFTFTNIAPNGIAKTTLFSLTGVVLSNQVEFRMERFETSGSATPIVINLTDFFKLTFNLTGLKISSGTLKIKEAKTLDSSKGVFGFNFTDPNMKDMKAFGAVLKKGSLNIKANNNSPLTGNIVFTLNEIRKGGVPVKASIPLNGINTIIDLSNSTIDFTKDPVIPYNQVPYTFSLEIQATSGNINYSTAQYIQMDIVMSNFEFQSFTGDFGKRSIVIDPGVFDMNVDMLNKIDGSFKLANPKLELTIHNSIGMPAKVDLDFTATNKAGATVALNPQVFTIPVPANLSAPVATKTIVFNRDSSNIVNFIALPPTGQISYSGKVDFNPSTTPVTPLKPNFLDMNATFVIDMAMELPLELQISNMAFKDTTSISGGDYDKLETAELILNARNGIPLDVDIQLQFIDTISKMQFGASKKTRILSATTLDSSGKMPLQSNKFTLEKADMVNLRKSNGIVIVGSISSPSAGAEVARIMSTSEIELNVVIKSKVNL
ncbi:MAG: hypothetical protein Q8S54_06265 [Bacteroidota bacterium]|nr:hypothetical protein [Bacteroidota bacterium]